LFPLAFIFFNIIYWTYYTKWSVVEHPFEHWMSKTVQSLNVENCSIIECRKLFNHWMSNISSGIQRRTNSNIFSNIEHRRFFTYNIKWWTCCQTLNVERFSRHWTSNMEHSNMEMQTSNWTLNIINIETGKFCIRYDWRILYKTTFIDSSILF
jgi:hypothetical protein